MNYSETVSRNTDAGNRSSIPAAWLLVNQGGDPRRAITLTAIIVALGRGYRWIIGMTLLFCSCAVAYTVLAPRMYESSLVVSVVDRGGADALSRSELGNLTSLVGLQVSGGDGHRSEYVALLSSRLVISRFLEKNNLMRVLFRDRWDSGSKQWKRTLLHPTPPTMNDAVRKFLGSLLVVNEDRTTGLLTISVKWRDPNLAAQWANDLVKEVNEQARSESLEEATRGLGFLRRQLETTSSIEVRDSIYRLMETSLNEIMMANIQEQFALKTVDPAVADPREVVRPQPFLDIALAVLAGLFLGSLIAMWRYSDQPPADSRAVDRSE